MAEFDKQLFAELLEKAKGNRSLNQFALHVDVSSAHISRLLRQLVNAPPEPKTIKKIADKSYGGVTYEDFMTAAGHIEYENELINKPEIESSYKLPTYNFKKTHEYLVNDVHHKYSTYGSKIPVIGTIRAGLPVLAEDNWEEQISIPDYLNADFALRIVGDSMSWTGINEGDLALMEQISAASHGQIVAAGVEDIEWQATLKFFVQENGGFKLRAANPAYADIVFTPQHRIIGRLIRIIKESPSLYDYKNMVVSKEVLDSDWQDAIMKACETGLDGKNIQDIIEMFANVVKNVK